MRRTALPAALLAVSAAVALTGCGTSSGTDHFKDVARPPTTLDLTVYVDNNHVSVSPARAGAGPVLLLVTNQASRTQTVKLDRAGGASIASSGPINSGQTAQINASLKQGTYRLATSGQVRAATLHIGKPRKNADNVLLQP